MTKAAITKLTPEEEAFLAEEQLKEQAGKSTLPQMKQLIINSDYEDDKGAKITPFTWNIRNEGTYVDTVQCQPLRYVQKFIRMVQEDKKWKNENESIFFNGFEPAYDANGTLGCGRIIGRLPATWTEQQKLENYKKATQYGFLFCLVTLPGKEPELVNFRASPSKDRTIREAVSKQTLGDKLKMYQVPYTMKLSPPPKGEKFPGFTMTPHIGKETMPLSTLMPYIRECDAYIAAHNERIMERRKQFEARLAGKAVYNEVRSLSTDFDDLETDFAK